MSREDIMKLKDFVVILAALIQLGGIVWFLSADHTILMTAIKEQEKHENHYSHLLSVVNLHSVDIGKIKTKIGLE